MAIRTFLFDLGNVLLRFSHEKMFAQMGSVCGRSADDIELFLVESGLMIAYDKGQVNDDDFCDQLAKFAHRAFAAEELLRATSDIFSPSERMESLVRELKRREYRLVLLSNTCPPHIDDVRRNWSILEPFDSLVLSYEVGAMKPEPAIFEFAKERIECDPSECLYTDDLEPFIDAARGFGFVGEVFRGEQDFRRRLAEHGVELDPV